MLNIDNQNLCELCFEKLPPKAKICPYCSGDKNINKYPTSLPEGTILVGRYSVGKVLGKGGFGITYLCYDLKEKRKVAIKEYLPDTLAHRNSGEISVTIYDSKQQGIFNSGAQKFYEEAKLVSRFNGNPNIISVYEFFYANNTTYFVMEYMSGMDLKKYLEIKNWRISEGELLYIVNRVTDALLIVHSTDTLHRDISPDNIFLCENGEVKLIDFGAARHVVAEISQSLSVILKPGFAPFEQYQSKGKQGPWTDIYALGATMYLSLTGKMPNNAMTRFDDPSLELNAINPKLAEIINKMMAVRYENRYQQIIDIKNDLRSVNIEQIPPKIKKQAPKSYCSKCGKEIPFGESICDDCARLQNGAPSYHTKVGETVVQQPKVSTGQNKIVFFLLSAVIVLTAAIMGLLGSRLLSDSGSVEDDSDDIYSFDYSSIPVPNPMENQNIISAYWHGVSGEVCDGVDWSLKGGVLTISGNGEMIDYELDQKEDIPWFEYNNQIKSVVINDGITYIGSNTFEGLSNLENVEISDSVTGIGYSAFQGCGINHISIPSSVSSIGSYAFGECPNLSSADFNIEISSNIFGSCFKLKNISSSLYVLEDGLLFNNERTELVGCFDYDKEYVDIPDGVNCILEDAFDGCINLKKVSIPESVNIIGNFAFFYTGLTSITIPSSVTTIGYCAFDMCYDLSEVIIENKEGNVSIDEYSFMSDVKITYTNRSESSDQVTGEITWSYERGVLTISGSGPMGNYNDGPVPWQKYSLSGSGYIDSVVIEEGVTHIGNRAFYSIDSLNSVTIPNSVTSIGDYAFAMTSLRSIIIPDSVTTIGDCAFESCILSESLTIPNSVTSIGDYAFDCCFGLSEVIIENKKGNVSIGEDAFPSGVKITYTK